MDNNAIKFNVMEGMKFRFRGPHPLEGASLTVGPVMTTCPCCGGELWTVAELPGCLISSDSLEMVKEGQAEDEQAAD